MSRAPFKEDFFDGLDGISRGWVSWLEKIGRYACSVSESGVTANRPTKNLWIGRPFFDTTLGKPVWYDGTNWVDATGATV